MATLKYRLGKTLDGDQTLSYGGKITKKEVMKPNKLVFGTLQSTTPQLNDEVLYYDTSNNQIFGGYIQGIKDSDGLQTITVGDYSIRLSQIKINRVYTNTTPEAIVEDIITNDTDLTFVSTVSTGVTIDKIVFRDEWAMDIIVKMLELFNGTYNVDLSKNFNMAVQSANTSSGVITRGVDKLDGSWNTDIEKKAEKVIVIGAVIDQRTTETISGTGTVFNTSYTPENVQISGLQQTTPDIDGDYSVDVQNKEITFDSSQVDPVVSYTYKSQIRVELGTGKTVQLEKKYIESKLEARKLAIEYRNKFEDGLQTSKWIKNASDIDTYNVGDQIFVTDATNNKTGFYVINSVTLDLPSKMVIEVGETEDDLFNWQKETIERIKQLEQTNSNADYVTVYDYLESSLNVKLEVVFTKIKTVKNNGDILFSSDTTLATDSDLISDTGVDADYALAYDDDGIPSEYCVNYLESLPSNLSTEGSVDITTEHSIDLTVEYNLVDELTTEENSNLWTEDNVAIQLEV